MDRKRPESLMLAGLVVLFSLPVLMADTPPTIKKVPAHATVNISGQDLFREYCAVCHGNDAKGAGPAAAALKVKPADLTLISRKSGNKFPEIRVQRVIKGDDEMVAHGSRDMPIWGQIFRHMSANEDMGSVRIYNLVKYIETLQAK